MLFPILLLKIIFTKLFSGMLYYSYSKKLNLLTRSFIMYRNYWKDAKGRCRCESCGKIVPENKLRWEKNLGYCEKCYAEIMKYNQKHKNKSN